jgi:Holliday junction resolvase-like predicted endonuclease
MLAGESLACDVARARYAILLPARSRFGEIDIIAKDRDAGVRRGQSWRSTRRGSAAEFVSPAEAQARSGRLDYLRTRQLTRCRFDVAAIDDRR